MDTYTLRARLYPALFVVFPIVLTLLAAFPEGPASWAVYWTLFVSSGGAFFLAQVGRDPGLEKQRRLYKKWGGKPTTIKLRHRGHTNRTYLGIVHQKLDHLFPDRHVPTVSEEQADPKAADEAYDAYVADLRALTRDQSRFPLLFEEDCNYGFRRNVWGMRPWGILMAVLGLISAVVLILFMPHARPDSAVRLLVVAGMLDFVLILVWIIAVTPSWVKITADAYADQLLAASLLF